MNKNKTLFGILLTVGLLFSFAGCKPNIEDDDINSTNTEDTKQDDTNKKDTYKSDTSFDVTLDKNNAIELAFSFTADEICFTVPAEYVSYKWYLDSTLQQDKTTNTCTYTKDAITNGSHEILVVVKESNGNYNSAKASFTVCN